MRIYARYRILPNGHCLQELVPAGKPEFGRKTKMSIEIAAGF